jgi:hypothetical protein
MARGHVLDLDEVSMAVDCTRLGAAFRMGGKDSGSKLRINPLVNSAPLSAGS